MPWHSSGAAPLSPACAGEGQGMNGGWLQSTEWRPSPPFPSFMEVTMERPRWGEEEKRAEN